MQRSARRNSVRQGLNRTQPRDRLSRRQTTARPTALRVEVADLAAVGTTTLLLARLCFVAVGLGELLPAPPRMQAIPLCQSSAMLETSSTRPYDSTSAVTSARPGRPTDERTSSATPPQHPT